MQRLRKEAVRRPFRSSLILAPALTLTPLLLSLLTAGCVSGGSHAQQDNSGSGLTVSCQDHSNCPVIVSSQAAGSGGSAAAAAPGSTATDSAPATQKPNGAELNHYDIDLPSGYSVALGVDRPAQQDYNTSSIGDIGEGNEMIAPSGNGDRMVYLPNGTPPSYSACTQHARFETIAKNVTGLSFCLLEAGRVAGVTITGIDPQPYSLRLHVVIWQNVTSG